MDTGMLTMAMEGKCSTGQLFLSDLKGTDTVFSVENQNSAYAADRRKVVKSKDATLSSSWHDETRGNDAADKSASTNGFSRIMQTNVLFLWGQTSPSSLQ